MLIFRFTNVNLDVFSTDVKESKRHASFFKDAVFDEDRERLVRYRERSRRQQTSTIHSGILKKRLCTAIVTPGCEAVTVVGCCRAGGIRAVIDRVGGTIYATSLCRIYCCAYAVGLTVG
jgi:hypothetical protein